MEDTINSEGFALDRYAKTCGVKRIELFLTVESDEELRARIRETFASTTVIGLPREVYICGESEKVFIMGVDRDGDFVLCTPNDFNGFSIKTATLDSFSVERREWIKQNAPTESWRWAFRQSVIDGKIFIDDDVKEWALSLPFDKG